MKYILAFLMFSGICLSQGVRFGDSVPTQTTTTVPGVSSNVVVAVPGATINFCAAPANSVPCTNKATTFTDSSLTVQCPSSAQVVLAGTNSCVTTTDAKGNWGVWVASGSYEYTVTVNGASSGPFPATPGGSGAGGVNCSLGAIAIPWFNSTTTLCDPNLTDDGSGNLAAATLTAATGITTPQLNMAGNAGFLIGPFQKQVAPSTNPPTGDMVCWGDISSNVLACKNSDGSNAMPSSSGGSLTVQTNGVSNTSQTTLSFTNPSNFNGLTFTYSNPSSGNETFAVGGTLDNSGITHPATTVNGTTCTLGSTCSVSGSAPTVVNGSSDTLTAAGTFTTQASITAGTASFLEIRAHGVFTTTGTASPVEAMQVNAGGTTGLCTHTGTNAINSSLTNDSWDVVCYVSILSTGAPGTASTWGLDSVTNGNANGTFLSKQFPQNAATQSFITTTAQTVSIQETGTLVSGESFTLQQLIIRAY